MTLRKVLKGVHSYTMLTLTHPIAELNEKGVAFVSELIGAPDAGGVVCARDPDGILIELVQR